MEKIKKFFSGIGDKIEKFIDNVVEKAKKFIEDVKSEGFVETVKKVTTSRGSSYAMKGWMMFDFMMDIMLCASAWIVLSWPLRFWTIFIILAHVYMITREFILAPIRFSSKSEDDGVVRGRFSFLKDSDVIIDHE